MKIKVWTVAADDDLGTRATVHPTEKEAYEQWLNLQSNGEASETIEAAAAFIATEDYDGLWSWADGEDFGDAFDTYAIEEHEIEIPISAAK